MRARIFCIASMLVIGLVSCKDKQPFIPDVPDPEPGGQTAPVLTEYRFSSSSRAWKEGDRIKVFFDGGEYIAVATFNGSEFVARSEADSSYPHDIFAGWPAERFSYYDNGIIAGLPSAQIVEDAGATDGDCAAMTAIAGTSAEGTVASLDFSEIFYVMELTLSNPSNTLPDEEFNSLSITSGKTPLCGYYKINLADGKPSGIVDNGSKSVSLSSGAFSSTSVVRLYVAETDFSGDVLSVRADSDNNAIIRIIETPAFSGGRLTASLPIDAACRTLQKKIFSGGAGTESDPWQIMTAKDLADLFDYSNGENIPEVFVDRDFTVASFVLGADIDMASSSALPSLYEKSAFQGRFDGAGHKISNLTINGGSKKVGFFSSVKNASICNLTLKNINVSTSSCAGGICGSAAGAEISGCTVSASTITSSGSYVGGIVGYAENADQISISNCVVGKNCTVYGDGYTGGIFGGAQNGVTVNVIIDKCAVYGNVSCEKQIIGGIAGGIGADPAKSSKNEAKDYHQASGTMVISNCAYIGGETGGEISTAYTSDANAYLGGIVGLGSRNSIANKGALIEVLNCYSRPSKMVAKVGGANSARWSAGGISGGMFASVKLYGCWSDITASKMSLAGSNAFGAITPQIGNSDCSVKYCFGIIKLKNSGTYDSTSKQLSEAQLTDDTLLGNLNDAVTNYTGGKATLSRWVVGEGNYPTLEGMLADPDKASTNSL